MHPAKRPADESRAIRLVLAVISRDPVMFEEAFIETAADGYGDGLTSLRTVIAVIADDLATVTATETPQVDLVAQLRKRLAGLSLANQPPTTGTNGKNLK